ncbi:hypothetical protein EDB19DRAFT_1836266 [Suillus lakei]|nr:hypothetical protein EDB19DRAFT_1836266 [Suillus lakei]
MAQSESPVIVPQQTKLTLIKSEIVVLKTHLKDWRTGKGQSHAQKPIYKEWLYNQCHRKAPKLLIKYGKKWTAHRVLIEQNKAQIQEETGETPGSEGMIVKWPEATKTVLASLLAEEKEEARVITEKWNNEAVLPDIQANVAETKGADMIEHFMTEMFKQARMRIFVMSAWQNQEGKLMLEVSKIIEDMTSMSSLAVGKLFEDKELGRELHARLVAICQRAICSLNWRRMMMGGQCSLTPQAGNTVINIIQLFLTRHYRMCMGNNKAAAAVPWGDLVKSQSDFFDNTYWPADVQLVEPSKVDKADTTALLYFWYCRQQRKLRPTFCFKAWKDTDGNMEKLAKYFLKAMRRATRHGQSTSKQKHASRQDEQSGDEEEVEEEHQSSADEHQEASMSANGRDESSPPKVTQRGLPLVSSDGPGDESASDNSPHINDSTGRYAQATPPVRSKMTSNITVALKTAHEPAKSGPHTTRQGLRSNVENEPPAKASKRRAATPISDMPARRTRSKAAVAEAPKAKQSRK